VVKIKGFIIMNIMQINNSAIAKIDNSSYKDLKISYEQIGQFYDDMQVKRNGRFISNKEEFSNTDLTNYKKSLEDEKIELTEDYKFAKQNHIENPDNIYAEDYEMSKAKQLETNQQRMGLAEMLIENYDKVKALSDEVYTNNPKNQETITLGKLYNLSDQDENPTLTSDDAKNLYGAGIANFLEGIIDEPLYYAVKGIVPLFHWMDPENCEEFKLY